MLLFLVLLFVVDSQAEECSGSQLILRSTTSISTVHSSEHSQYILQQSIGQTSVIGTYESDEHLLSQGFVQPNLSIKIVDFHDAIDLKAKIFPNPFIDLVHVSFLETVNQPVQVVIFNDLGSVLKSFVYDASQELRVRLDDLPLGRYCINMLMNGKQFSDHLIKLK